MVNKTNKLKQVEEVKLDGHVHVFSNPRSKANVWWRDSGSRRLVDLIEQVKKSGINCVGLTNAGDDWLYERFVSQVDDLPNDWGYYQDERVTQVLDRDGIPCIFFKAEELFTKEGHMLIWGTQFGQMFQPVANLKEYEEKVSKEFRIDDILDEIERDTILTKISDHTFYRGGLGETGELEKRKHRFDAYEWNASTSEEANGLVWINAHGKPVVCNSDAHRLKDIGKAYQKFVGRLNFDSGKDFIASLRENVRQNKIDERYTEMLPFGAFLHHAYMILVDHKFGLYDKDVETDDFNIDEEKLALKIRCEI
ncbi:MAG: hypothetical protein KJ559_03125 [Nanoarchaeota archaeon]|nr:hypothetical protein [Nanoarchaeota archaeon]